LQFWTPAHRTAPGSATPARGKSPLVGAPSILMLSSSTNPKSPPTPSGVPAKTAVYNAALGVSPLPARHGVPCPAASSLVAGGRLGNGFWVPAVRVLTSRGFAPCLRPVPPRFWCQGERCPSTQAKSVFEQNSFSFLILHPVGLPAFQVGITLDNYLWPSWPWASTLAQTISKISLNRQLWSPCLHASSSPMPAAPAPPSRLSLLLSRSAAAIPRGPSGNWFFPRHQAWLAPPRKRRPTPYGLRPPVFAHGFFPALTPAEMGHRNLLGKWASSRPIVRRRSYFVGGVKPKRSHVVAHSKFPRRSCKRHIQHAPTPPKGTAPPVGEEKFLFSICHPS